MSLAESSSATLAASAVNQGSNAHNTRRLSQCHQPGTDVIATPSMSPGPSPSSLLNRQIGYSGENAALGGRAALALLSPASRGARCADACWPSQNHFPGALLILKNTFLDAVLEVPAGRRVQSCPPCGDITDVEVTAAGISASTARMLSEEPVPKYSPGYSGEDASLSLPFTSAPSTPRRRSSPRAAPRSKTPPKLPRPRGCEQSGCIGKPLALQGGERVGISRSRTSRRGRGVNRPRGVLGGNFTQTTSALAAALEGEAAAGEAISATRHAAKSSRESMAAAHAMIRASARAAREGEAVARARAAVAREAAGAARLITASRTTEERLVPAYVHAEAEALPEDTFASGARTILVEVTAEEAVQKLEKAQMRKALAAAIYSPRSSVPDVDQLGEASSKSTTDVVETPASRQSRRKRGCAARLWCHIYLDERMLQRGFDLIPVIIGKKGANTRKIWEATNTKVRVRGRGSGHLEFESGREATVHLMVAVAANHSDVEDFMQAVRLVCQLLQSVSMRFEEFRRRDNHCTQSFLKPGRYWLREAAKEHFDVVMTLVNASFEQKKAHKLAGRATEDEDAALGLDTFTSR